MKSHLDIAPRVRRGPQIIVRQMLKAAPFVKTDCGFQACIGLEPYRVRPHGPALSDQSLQHLAAYTSSARIFSRRHLDDLQPFSAITRIMMRWQDRSGPDNHIVEQSNDNLPAFAQNRCFQFFQLFAVAFFQNKIFLDPVAIELDECLPVSGAVATGRDRH